MWPKWLRGLITVWVAWDSHSRKGAGIFWTAVVFILGPLLVPFYLAARPLLAGETRRGSFWWNAIWNFERLFAALAALAGMAVCAQNMQIAESKDLAVVKRAEIKAGTLAGLIATLVLLLIERVGMDTIKANLEKDLSGEN
ncbi:MAG TPA: hypothetical protein PKM25_03780 [Candidatus Ozemobacteraceae bacterium]|nr:hypothetical protein [Candidatus Ozemobacteraceae bacterium]